MAEPNRDQLLAALRKADAANDTAAAKAIARRIASMDEEGLDGVVVTDDRPSTAKQLGRSTLNTAAGVANAIGGVPDLLVDAASAVNRGVNTALTEGGGALLDVFGFDNAAHSLRETGRDVRARQANTAENMKVRTATERLVPTRAGEAAPRFAAELVAGLAIPLGPKAKPQISAPRNALARSPNAIDDAPRVIAEGQRRNVPVMTTDVAPPRSAPGRFFKQTVPEKIPFAGTSGPRAAQQEARQRAVIEVVEEFGGDTGRALFDDSDTIAQQISKELTEQRGARISNLKTAKDSVIDGMTGTAPVPRTIKALDEQIAAMVKRDTPASREVAEILLSQKAELTKPRTLRGLEDFRADELSNAFSNPDTLASVKTVGEKALRKIYDPLRKDMGDFIEAVGDKAVRAKWSRANEELSTLADELKSAAFKNVLKASDTTPESINRILFSNADNVSDMRRLVSNLDEPARRKVQGALLSRAFDKAGGTDGVSVERFLANLKQLSGKIGVAFQGEDRAALDGVRRLLEATRRGAEASAKVRTGEQNVPTILGIGATQAFGVAGGVTSLGVGGLIARLYESPAVRNLVIRLSKAPPGSVAEGQILARITRASVPVINNWKDDALRIANDNAGMAAAAEEPNQ